jgi:hypothetical protein
MGSWDGGLLLFFGQDLQDMGQQFWVLGIGTAVLGFGFWVIEF